MAKRGKPPRKKERKPSPKCKAMLLCDQTIVEAVSGKVSLIGTFTAFFVPAFPGFTAPFTVFMQLSGGIGKCKVQVEIQDLREDTVLARSPIMEIEFTDRLQLINICLPVPRLPVAHDGAYDLVAIIDGQLVESQKFHAISPGGKGNA